MLLAIRILVDRLVETPQPVVYGARVLELQPVVATLKRLLEPERDALRLLVIGQLRDLDRRGLSKEAE